MWRVENVFAREGIKYVGQLVTIPVRDLKKLKRFGKNSYSLVEEILNDMGLEPGMNITYVPPEERDIA